MRPRQIARQVRLGVGSLLLHKLRSLLTTLGVLFGVSSVIAMLAVGEGASEEAQEQIRQLGSQNVILRSIKPPDDKVSNQTSRVLAYGLTQVRFSFSWDPYHVGYPPHAFYFHYFLPSSLSSFLYYVMFSFM